MRACVLHILPFFFATDDIQSCGAITGRSSNGNHRSHTAGTACPCESKISMFPAEPSQHLTFPFPVWVCTSWLHEVAMAPHTCFCRCCCLFFLHLQHWRGITGLAQQIEENAFSSHPFLNILFWLVSFGVKVIVLRSPLSNIWYLQSFLAARKAHSKMQNIWSVSNAFFFYTTSLTFRSTQHWPCGWNVFTWTDFKCAYF